MFPDDWEDWMAWAYPKGWELLYREYVDRSELLGNMLLGDRATFWMLVLASEGRDDPDVL